MTLRSVRYVRAQDMTPEQREKLKVRVDRGLVAIETHNHEYEWKATVIKGNIVDYILHGE